MSIINPNIAFDFSGITGNQVPSINDAGNAISSGCTPSSSPDPKYGDYLGFASASSLTVLNSSPSRAVDISNGFTANFWIYLTAATSSGGNVVFTVDQSTTNVWGLTVNNSSGSSTEWSLGDGTSNFNLTVQNTCTNQWMYVSIAVAIDGTTTLQLCIDNTWYNQSEQLTLPDFLSSSDTQDLMLGTTDTSFDTFSGNVAWFSLYNQVLNQSQLQSDMLLVNVKEITFRRSFPLDFTFTSQVGGDSVPVLFIEQEGKGKDMSLSITNSGTTDFNIPTGAGAASGTNFHFQLHFQPGVLSHNYRAKANQASTQTWISGSWSFNLVENTKTGNWHLNMLNTGSPVALTAGQATAISLGAINADPLGGARNTTVMLQYNLPQTGAQALIGHRKQTVSIISRLGQKDIPLHVGTIHLPRILNNNTEQSLFIRIENTGDDPLPMKSAVEETNAILELGFLIQSAERKGDWALIDSTEIEGVTCQKLSVYGTVVSNDEYNKYASKVDNLISPTLNEGSSIIVVTPDNEWINCQVQGNGAWTDSGSTWIAICKPNTPDDTYYPPVNSRIFLTDDDTTWNVDQNGLIPTGATGYFSWKITSNNAPDLQKGDSIHILLSGIKTTLPLGQSLITIKYFNIGGYWDGQLELPVVRSAISEIGGSVAIGMPASDDYPFQIKNNNAPTDGDNSDDSTLFSINQSGDIDISGYVKIEQSALYSGTDPLPDPVVQIPINNAVNQPSILLGSNSGPNSTGGAITINGIGPKLSLIRYNNDPSAAHGNVLFEVLANGYTGIGVPAVNNAVLQVDYPPADQPGVNGIVLADSGFVAPSPGVGLFVSPGNSTQIPMLVQAFFIKNKNVTSLGNAMKVGTNGVNYLSMVEVVPPANPVEIPLVVNGAPTSGSGQGYSIQAQHNILYNTDTKVSDERSKKNIAPSDSLDDLSLLNSLKVSNYHFIQDDIHPNAQKGLIGQELKEVFPQAVHLVKRAIPNILAKASNLSYNRETQVLTVQLETEHGLALGDEVWLETDKTIKDALVVEVHDGKSFSVEKWEQDVSEALVLGKMVDDFHGVDYNQIHMLSVSSIQQLSKEVEALKAENASLKQQLSEGLAELRKEIEGLKK